MTVLIHEMVVPADVWAAKNLGYRTPADAQNDPSYATAKAYAENVQNSSHTPQGAFGYILSQINPPPRLAVATHFQATDDTIKSAMKSIRKHYRKGDVTIAADLMVISVTPRKHTLRRAVIADYAWYPLAKIYPNLAPPKYATATDQDDLAESIPPGTDDNGNPTYDPSGY